MAVYSQNGYVANDVALTKVYTVPKSKVKFRLRKGPVAAVLLYVAAWVDENIEDIDTRAGVRGFDVADDWSFAVRPIRGQTKTLSNHASGTAIDINAVSHGRGVHGTWSASEKAKIHAFLATLDGVVRWGEDYSSASVIDGMHFEINASEARVAAVAKKIGQTGSKSRTALTSVLAVLALTAAGYGVHTATNPGPPAPKPVVKPAPKPSPSKTSKSIKTVTKPTKKPVVKPAPKPSKPSLKRVLTVGSHGSDVRYLQARLGLHTDGIYGPKTRAAVIRYQKAHHLKADGLVGKKTWSTIR